jgi:RNA polymerase sigma-70 factor (sigma-E family)
MRVERGEGSTAVMVTPQLPEEAWRNAFTQYFPDLVRLAALLDGSPDNAEDLAQEAFVRAASRLESMGDESVKPYLMRTVVNLWKNSIRRRVLERRSIVIPIDQSDDEMHSVDERDRVWTALSHLPRRQRGCVVLRYYEDLSEAETAHILGISRGAVKSHLNRALRKLEEELYATD